ncbi:hypothetical protein KKA00_10595, partial [bacterium]|nr:hypothetical protein [bacterium]
MSNKPTDFYLIVKKTKFDALKDGLVLLDEDKLRKMAAYWLGSEKAMIHPEMDVRAELTDALGNTEQTAHIFDRLPKRSYDLFNYLLSEGGQLSAEELEKNFMGGKAEPIRTHLDPLLRRGLVWECRTTAKAADTARFFILNTAAEYVELPSFLEGKLGTVLPHRSNDQIKALAAAFGADIKKVRTRNDQIAWLRTEVRNPTCFRRFFDSCDADERKLLKILALHDSGLPADELIHQYSLFTNGEPETELRDAFSHLLDELGLIDTHTETIGTGRHKQSFIIFRLPSEINLLIRSNFKQKFKDEIPPITLFESPDEDFALGSRGKERPTIWIDFQQLLNHLIRCEVGVIRKGGMHKKNLKRILDRLESEKVDAYLYLDFLFLYAHHQEVLYPDKERWAINVDHIRPVQSVFSFYRDFWAFYYNNGSWNDRDSSPLQGVIQKGDSDSIFGLRRALLRQLGDCPAGEWIEMESFFDELCDREMAFRCGEPPFASSDPLKEKFRFMKSTMERSLRWIGLLDTTTVPNQRINLFRLTEIGRWLLSSGKV